MGVDIYPTGDSLNSDWFRTDPLEVISKETPITSMGSCFARHVGLWLHAEGYRFLRPTRGRWDRMYSSFLIRQEVERCYGYFSPSEKFWTNGKVRDPYRQGVSWKCEEDALGDLGRYEKASRAILDTANVFIATIGVNEIWRNSEDGAVFFQRPPVLAANHVFERPTVEENIANLRRIRELFAGLLIVTVSPIPLLQTFAPGNVIENNAESKATLLLAAKRFSREAADTHYFPSFEMVMTQPAPFAEDNRHIRPEVVKEVMETFEHNFGKTGDK